MLFQGLSECPEPRVSGVCALRVTAFCLGALCRLVPVLLLVYRDMCTYHYSLLSVFVSALICSTCAVLGLVLIRVLAGYLCLCWKTYYLISLAFAGTDVILPSLQEGVSSSEEAFVSDAVLMFSPAEAVLSILNDRASKIVVGCGFCDRHSFYLQAVSLSGSLIRRGVFENIFRKDLIQVKVHTLVQ